MPRSCNQPEILDSCQGYLASSVGRSPEFSFKHVLDTNRVPCARDDHFQSRHAHENYIFDTFYTRFGQRFRHILDTIFICRGKGACFHGFRHVLDTGHCFFTHAVLDTFRIWCESGERVSKKQF